MPYIPEQRRISLEYEFITNYLPQSDCAGELNYLFTILVADYLGRKGLNYQNLNDCIGALEGAKLELYRRVATPYEDNKLKSNGDVYPQSLLTQKESK